jgi:radical SAM protein with 4Fe4S-binding SPASM domain
MSPHAAEYTPYGGPGKHRPLLDMLPLSTPLSVFIDPSDACNRQCSYCPTGRAATLDKSKQARGVMELTLFKKIVEDLGRFPGRLRKLHLYKDGEPLLNEHLEIMIETAKRGNVTESIELTTNGTLLTRERSHSLIKSGLDRIRVSIQPPSGLGDDLLRSCSLYNQVLRNVEMLWQEKERARSHIHVHAKTIDFELSADQVEAFRNDFSGIANTIHIDVLMGWSRSTIHDFALGSHPDTDMSGQTLMNMDRIVCPHPFYSLAVNRDGQVSPCCVDWSKGAVVGNVCAQSLVDIWQGPLLREFRLMHLRAMRYDNPVCGDCQYMLGASAASVLDANRIELIQTYNVQQ